MQRSGRSGRKKSPNSDNIFTARLQLAKFITFKSPAVGQLAGNTPSQVTNHHIEGPLTGGWDKKRTSQNAIVGQRSCCRHRRVRCCLAGKSAGIDPGPDRVRVVFLVERVNASTGFTRAAVQPSPQRNIYQFG